MKSCLNFARTVFTSIWAILLYNLFRETIWYSKLKKDNLSVACACLQTRPSDVTDEEREIPHLHSNVSITFNTATFAVENNYCYRHQIECNWIPLRQRHYLAACLFSFFFFLKEKNHLQTITPKKIPHTGKKA